MAESVEYVCFPVAAKLLKYKVKEESAVNNGTVLCEYALSNSDAVLKLKSVCHGTVKELLAKEGAELQHG